MEKKEIKGKLIAEGLSFAIVAARFNERITKILVEGAIDCLDRHNASSVKIYWVPGAFEIPLLAKKLAKEDKYHAIICLGAIIRGDTPHFEYIASEVTKGIANINLELVKPVVYGIITADSTEQALERAGVKHGNRGWDAAMSAIELANLLKENQ